VIETRRSLTRETREALSSRLSSLDESALTRLDRIAPNIPRRTRKPSGATAKGSN
jgi:hypothetical protein